LQLPKWNAIAISIWLLSLKRMNEHPRSFECIASHRRIVRSQFSIYAIFLPTANPAIAFPRPRISVAFFDFSQEWHATDDEENARRMIPSSIDREMRTAFLSVIASRSVFRAQFFWHLIARQLSANSFLPLPCSLLHSSSTLFSWRRFVSVKLKSWLPLIFGWFFSCIRLQSPVTTLSLLRSNRG